MEGGRRGDEVGNPRREKGERWCAQGRRWEEKRTWKEVVDARSQPVSDSGSGAEPQ